MEDRRAYRVNEYAPGGETFNLCHDEGVAQYLNDNGHFAQLNEDGVGFIDVPVTALGEMLKIADNDQTRSNIKEDIEFAKRCGKEYLRYGCF